MQRATARHGIGGGNLDAVFLDVSSKIWTCIPGHELFLLTRVTYQTFDGRISEYTLHQRLSMKGKTRI